MIITNRTLKNFGQTDLEHLQKLREYDVEEVVVCNGKEVSQNGVSGVCIVNQEGESVCSNIFHVEDFEKYIWKHTSEKEAGYRRIQFKIDYLDSPYFVLGLKLKNKFQDWFNTPVLERPLDRFFVGWDSIDNTIQSVIARLCNEGCEKC